MDVPNQPRRLDSWKEIAAFLRRDVRTVQRWEHEGLPVHRRPGAKRGAVFACEDELDAWFSGRLGKDLGTTAAPAAAAATAGEAPRRGISRQFLFVAWVLLVVALGLAGVAASRSRHVAEPTKWRTLAISSTPMRIPHWADVNGDGRADLVVNPFTSPTLIFNSAAGRECATEAMRCADTRIHTPEACHSHTSRPGDFNGDGVDDLIVSCLLREPEAFTATGATYIVLGRRQWPRDVNLPADADVTLSTSVRHDDRVHGCLHSTSRSDVNGDGVDDVLIGGVEVPFEGRLSAGALYVFYGRRIWPSALAFSDASVTIGGSRMAEGIGNLCAVGDFDGDRRVDIAVHATETPLWNMLGGAGRTYLIRGRANWPAVIDLAREPVMQFEGPPSGTRSQQLALADLDGDGRDDLFFSAPASMRDANAGSRIAMWRGRVFSSSVMPFASADAILEGASSTSMFGSSLVPADLDMDGTPELLVDEPRHGTINVVVPRPGGLAVTTRITAQPTVPDGASETAAVTISGSTLAIVTVRPGQWRLAVGQPFMPIAIDVRPHNTDDVILRPGIAAVGIPAQPNADIDPASLRAAGARPIGHTTDDFNGDGRPDLIGYFRTEEMRLPGDATSLTLVGRTRKGTYVRGQSAVRIVTVTAGR